MWVGGNGARWGRFCPITELEHDLPPLVTLAEWLMVDSAIVCAHWPAAGAKGNGAAKEALGRSPGGFITKMHAACDSHGNPLRFILSRGQVADCKQALALFKGLRTDAVLVDKGYNVHRTYGKPPPS